MPISIEKVIVEFVAYIDGFDLPIKARITESLEHETGPMFNWSISHYWSTSADSDVYSPSVKSAKTMDEVETSLMIYMKAFKNVGVALNPYY